MSDLLLRFSWPPLSIKIKKNYLTTFRMFKNYERLQVKWFYKKNIFRVIIWPSDFRPVRFFQVLWSFVVVCNYTTDRFPINGVNKFRTCTLEAQLKWGYVERRNDEYCEFSLTLWFVTVILISVIFKRYLISILKRDILKYYNSVWKWAILQSFIILLILTLLRSFSSRNTFVYFFHKFVQIIFTCQLLSPTYTYLNKYFTFHLKTNFNQDAYNQLKC